MSSVILVLPKLKIHNANALSSPFTIGFPALTAWLGGVHAMQRKLNQDGFDELKFTNVGVVCHDFDLQTYRGQGDYIHSIIGTGNPLDKDGKRPSFIEEARCHLTVTLVIECEGINPFTTDDCIEKIKRILSGNHKFAGGDLLSFGGKSDLLRFENTDEETGQKKLLRSLMPGYVLIERKDLMLEAMQKQDALDALMDNLSVKHCSEMDDEQKITWTSKRNNQGWIVPIAVGFHGISDLLEGGKTLNQRDTETPHRFAEAIVTLGEFVMPYRLETIDKMMWHYQYEKENNLYICKQ